jgi:cytidylate kinase
MSIVTISRGSYSRGKEVAEKLAQKLNYECVSRDILLEACSEFNLPEIKLVRALHDAPSVLERFQHGKERYMSYYRYVMLKHLQKDNVVYHGLAGHFLLRDIPHVLKVRIIADMEDRIREEMKRENISREKALYILKKDDEERRKWSLHVHGADTLDCRLYDMILHISTLTVDDAVQILYETVLKSAFQTTPESQRIMDDLTKAAQIHSMLVNISHRVTVVVKDRTAMIGNVGEDLKTDSSFRERIEMLVSKVEGIDSVLIQEPLVPKSTYINPYHNI